MSGSRPLDSGSPGAHGSPASGEHRDLEEQLALQRRILEAVAERDEEIRVLRRALDERSACLASHPDVIRLRERWLEAKERVVRLEGRIEELQDGAVARVPAPAGSERGSPARSFAACTIVCRNYLAQARALFESLREREPAARLYLLVLDAEPDTVEVDAAIEVVSPGRLPIPDFPSMSFKYGVVEFNTAVKPYFLSLLLDAYGEEEVVYFDPDILVTRRLDELRDALASSSIVLTPHITTPIPEDGLTPSEPDIMVSGAYNLGFIGLRATSETRRFLSWWARRLEDGCRIDVSHGLFTDQKWIDLVPGLFPDTTILRHPGYNVAFWNLHEREIERAEGRYLVNGLPAAFFHISGFDPRRPDLVSKHQTRTRVEPGSGLARLLEEYAARLERHGWASAREDEYGYERFADGLRVHPLLRRLYLGLDEEKRRALGDPYRDLGPTGFRAWATRPRPESGGLSYFLLELYEARVDLQEAFPDVRGRDRGAFLEWARTQGTLEMDYAPDLVREPEAEPSSNGEHPPEEGAPGDPFVRLEPTHYEALVDRIRHRVDASLPEGATVAVVSRGDYRLMHLGGRQAWHFPRADNGLYAGYHPRTSDDAISHLEELRASGADYLLFPATSAWWLDYYDDFHRHLDGRYARLVDDPAVCVIYALDTRPPAEAAVGHEASNGRTEP